MQNSVDIFISKAYNNAKVMIEVAEVMSNVPHSGWHRGTERDFRRRIGKLLGKADTWGCREHLLHCRYAESYHDAAWISC